MFSVRLPWQDLTVASFILVTTVQLCSWPILSNGQRKSKVNGTVVLSRANGFTVVAEAGSFVYWKKKKRKSKKKKDTMGSNVTPWDATSALQWRSCLESHRKLSDCIYLLLQKRRFFIAALICQLIIFSYKNPALVPCIHPMSYHDSIGEVQGDL